MSKRALAFVGALSLLIAATSLVTSRPVARARQPDYFSIYFTHVDEHFRLGTFVFDVPLWEFGDRAGYRCAWGFLMSGGQRVARVQFDRGQTYAGIIDQFGAESSNDFSQCIPETELAELETKPKPAGLADTIVDLNLGGTTLDSMTFPETSGEDSLSWWELEEAEPDHVEIELYWGEDVAVIANITSLSPSMTFAARSTAAPTISSFTPTSGGPGSLVTITGANFVGASAVTFNGTSAAFEAHSAGEIVATVPAGATSGPIAVTTPTGTVTSSGNFTVAGGALPAITSFSPTSGKAGTSVTITGANFVDVSSVTFNGTGAAFQANSATEIVATVPDGATSGPIEVTTSTGKVTSQAAFIVPSGITHPSGVWMKLSGRLIAKGAVRSLDGTPACVSGRTVVIERRVNGTWRNAGKDETGPAGFYYKKVKDKSGLYRARVKQAVLANGDACLGDVSKRRAY